MPSCPQCTFVNASGAPSCEMCQTVLGGCPQCTFVNEDGAVSCGVCSAPLGAARGKGGRSPARGKGGRSRSPVRGKASRVRSRSRSPTNFRNPCKHCECFYDIPSGCGLCPDCHDRQRHGEPALGPNRTVLNSPALSEDEGVPKPLPMNHARPAPQPLPTRYRKRPRGAGPAGKKQWDPNAETIVFGDWVAESIDSGKPEANPTRDSDSSSSGAGSPPQMLSPNEHAALHVDNCDCELCRSMAKETGAEAQHEDATLCVACLDGPREVALFPCRHLCLCQGCVEAVLERGGNLCPLCKGAVDSHCKLFV